MNIEQSLNEAEYDISAESWHMEEGFTVNFRVYDLGFYNFVRGFRRDYKQGGL